MTKTTLYLEDDIALQLRLLAAAQERSQAEILREAISSYTRAHISRPPLPGMGQYRSGKTDTASNAESILAEAASGKRKWR